MLAADGHSPDLRRRDPGDRPWHKSFRPIIRSYFRTWIMAYKCGCVEIDYSSTPWSPRAIRQAQTAGNISMAEGAGFEPAIRFPVYTLSRRAPSTARPPLRCLGAFPPRCAKDQRAASSIGAIRPAQARGQAANSGQYPAPLTGPASATRALREDRRRARRYSAYARPVYRGSPAQRKQRARRASAPGR